MNVKPYPWNPFGFIRPSVEHLFPRPSLKTYNYQPPAPSSYFVVGSKRDPARTTKLMKARI